MVVRKLSRGQEAAQNGKLGPKGPTNPDLRRGKADPRGFNVPVMNQGEPGDTATPLGGLGLQGKRNPNEGGLGPNQDGKGGLGPNKEDKGGLGPDGKSSSKQENEPDALKMIIDNFGELDANKNKFLEPNEIQAAEGILQKKMQGQQFNQEGKNVFKNLVKDWKSLIFKFIDPEQAAWGGLSINDLKGLHQDRETNQRLRGVNSPNVRSNKQIPQTSASSRERIAPERGLRDASAQTFEEYVNRIQAQIRANPGSGEFGTR